MAEKEKADQPLPAESTDNPLNAYNTAITTLQDLCKTRNNQVRMEAAQTLLRYVATPPTVDWGFLEEIEDA